MPSTIAQVNNITIRQLVEFKEWLEEAEYIEVEGVEVQPSSVVRMIVEAATAGGNPRKVRLSVDPGGTEFPITVEFRFSYQGWLLEDECPDADVARIFAERF